MSPDVLAAKVNYAERLAHAGLLPKAYQRQPANILLMLEQAQALGISLPAALNGVHVIDGKPTISAGLMSALVRRAGHKLRVTGDDTQAVAEIVRADDPDFTFRSVWTLDRAKKAGLAGKGSWGKYPAAMLKARAISEVCRDACEEALSGVHYTAEELGAEVSVSVDGDVVVADSPVMVNPFVAPDPVEDVVDAEVVDAVEVLPGDGPPPLSSMWGVLIDEAESLDELRELWREVDAAGHLEQWQHALRMRADELTAQ
jgi:hypothetical protein